MVLSPSPCGPTEPRSRVPLPRAHPPVPAGTPVRLISRAILSRSRIPADPGRSRGGRGSRRGCHVELWSAISYTGGPNATAPGLAPPVVPPRRRCTDVGPLLHPCVRASVLLRYDEEWQGAPWHVGLVDKRWGERRGPRGKSGRRLPSDLQWLPPDTLRDSHCAPCAAQCVHRRERHPTQQEKLSSDGESATEALRGGARRGVVTRRQG